ncbi:MAG: CRISPR-associated endoribonuclease Cas6 [Caldilineaceae bacterium]|nr:CRISPR-associated endoribonuclease Cas6 [Caldilineaceae bacterium]
MPNLEHCPFLASGRGQLSEWQGLYYNQGQIRSLSPREIRNRKEAMLIALTLTLTSPSATTVPSHLGRANYAATLAALQALDPALGPLIHEGDGPKPLTCSGILNGRGQRAGMAIQADQPYVLRITGLTTPVSEALAAALLATPPTTWTLDGHPFQVQAVTCDPAADPWTGQTSYETLAAAQLIQGERPQRQVTLRFVTPTTFTSNNMTVPVPLPSLVFGSLVERWNAFSPVTLSPEMRRFGEEMVALSRYRLESKAVVQKNKGLRIGAVGEATYTALGGDRYWLGVLQMLADFANYSGVGAQTTQGMGQVHRVR